MGELPYSLQRVAKAVATRESEGSSSLSIQQYQLLLEQFRLGNYFDKVCVRLNPGRKPVPLAQYLSEHREELWGNYVSGKVQWATTTLLVDFDSEIKIVPPQWASELILSALRNFRSQQNLEETLGVDIIK